MNLSKVLLLLLIMTLGQSCTPPTTNHYLSIELPTIEQEATSIWRIINDIVFLEGQGYRIHLPQNDSIQALIAKSKNGTFGNEDFPTIYNLLESGLYQSSHYEAALEKVKDQEALINDMLHQLQFAKKSWDWEFQTFEQYPIVFTLYGTGGSYDPDLGSVTLFTTLDGDFMNYDKPANTIIHEIVHMGIEKSIVQAYNLPHGLKERLVDTVVYLLFGGVLPEYKIQNMGDPKIDALVRSKEDLKTLRATVEKFMAERSSN